MLMTERPTRDETTTLACHADRVQPYRFIHKGLRALMLGALQQAGALDAAHAEERARLVAAVDELLQVCADHLAHENTFFHAPLRERAPRAVLPFDDDHRDHLTRIAALRAQLTRFVADNLEHMAEEETQLTCALWQHFSDDEILALEDRLRATFTPRESAYYLRWMARGLSHGELLDLAVGARAVMPQEAFQGLCALLQAELSASGWARLARALEPAPEPGLATA